jgi:signal transduction histidine kinase
VSGPPPKDRIDDPLQRAMIAEWLVAAAAHDLAAPLLTVQGFLTAIESEARQGDWQCFSQDIERIKQCCEQMRRSLEELREFTRGSHPITKRERCLFDELVGQALSRSAASCPAGHHVQVDAPMPTVQGDPRGLVRALQNLLENAFRAVGDQPDPMIRVSGQECSVQSVIIITIVDNGCGFPSETAERLFEPYHQFGSRPGRSGLGLAIARRIARAHGGDVTLSSDGLGHGATAVLWLPRE